MTAAEKAASTASLMEVMENLTPIFDAVEGIRADLNRRGWSPTQAEVCAGEWLVGALRFVWASQTPGGTA